MVRNAMVLLLLAVSTLSACGQPKPSAAEQQACAADKDKFCADVKPGGGRILDCLAGHKAELVEACRKVVESHGK